MSAPEIPLPEAPLFEVTDLHASTTDGVEILRGVDLVIQHGEVHALMGPNGSGKSTLASVLLGSPEYVVTSGSVRFRGDEITDWSPDVRGKAGIFLAFQFPLEITGVSVINFLRYTYFRNKTDYHGGHPDYRGKTVPPHGHVSLWMEEAKLSPATLKAAGKK